MTALPKVLGFVFSHTGLKSGLAERLKAILHIMQNGGDIADDLIETRCQRGAAIAASLRLPTPVCDGIHSLDEHWNGGGRPDRLAGQRIPLYARIALLAQVVDVFHRSSGREAALTEARRRAGTWFDPDVVDSFDRAAQDPGFWETLESPELEAAVFALEPKRSSDRRRRGLPRRYRPGVRSGDRFEEPLHLRPFGTRGRLCRPRRGRDGLRRRPSALAPARRPAP